MRNRKRANVGNVINQIVPNRFTLKLSDNEPRREQRVKFKSIHMRVRVHGARANYNAILQNGFNNERKEREERSVFSDRIRTNHIILLSLSNFLPPFSFSLRVRYLSNVYRVGNFSIGDSQMRFVETKNAARHPINLKSS